MLALTLKTVAWWFLFPFAPAAFWWLQVMAGPRAFDIAFFAAAIGFGFIPYAMATFVFAWILSAGWGRTRGWFWLTSYAGAALTFLAGCIAFAYVLDHLPLSLVVRYGWGGETFRWDVAFGLHVAVIGTVILHVLSYLLLALKIGRLQALSTKPAPRSGVPRTD